MSSSGATDFVLVLGQVHYLRRILLHKNNKQLIKNLHFAFRAFSSSVDEDDDGRTDDGHFLKNFAEIFYFTLNCIPDH